MLKILDASQIRRVDDKTIQYDNIPSIDLMERASLAVFDEILPLINPAKTIYIFAGPGNNGGDALALARMLLLRGIKPVVYVVSSDGTLSANCLSNKERFKRLYHLYCIRETSEMPVIEEKSIIIDGLFGSGLNRPLKGIFEKIIHLINDSACKIFSIDLPSGMFVEDNTNNNPQNIIKADHVITFRPPKLSLLFPESNNYCKKLTIIDIGLSAQALEEEPTDYFMTEAADMAKILRRRDKFSHKGNFGKVMLIAGSKGKMGAAVLAAKACLHTGAGLLTMHIPACGTDIMQISIPEAMVSADTENNHISRLIDDIENYTIGTGCGIGMHPDTKKALAKLLENGRKPMVIDADALNLISSDNNLKYNIPPKSILTPHPAEFERLIGEHCASGYERLQHARQFAQKFDLYILLKGAFTAIVTPERTVYFNPTGNPGMATGGSGDALTGILTSLLAQGYTPLNTALLGTYLHGLAGDLAAKKRTQYSMLPSDLIDNLGCAFRFLECQKE